MKKIIPLLLLGFAINKGIAQNISSKKWTDLFSFNNVLAIKEDNGKFICATENGLFFYQAGTGEITKLTKANGLHEVKISAFDYDPQTNTGLIGYQNGALDVFSDQGTIMSVDIPIAQSYNGSKKINHISISGTKAIISVNYGVSIFDLTKREFGLSCFFINAGTYTPAIEATIKGDQVYAATNSGLITHTINTTFPVFSTWTTLVPGNFVHVDSDGFAAASTKTTLFIENAGSFTPVTEGFGEINDIVVTSQEIIVTDKNKIYTVTTGGGILAPVDMAEDCNTAIKVGSKIYAGTKISGLKDTSNKTYKPDGPFSNTSYKIALAKDQIWVSTGARDSYNAAIYNDLGYYHFDGMKWIYPNYFVDNPIKFNVLDVEPNPANISEVFFTNYNFIPGEKGIYKMKNNEFVKVYKNTDSGSFNNRQVGICFDENNNMFVSAHFLAGTPLTIGYYTYNKTSDDFTLVPMIAGGGAQKPFARDGILYTPAPFFGDGGLILKRYDTNPASTTGKVKIIRKEQGLPANGTVSAAIDLDGDVWIGTRVGLRILEDASAAIDDPAPMAEPIIIEQNGIGEELFRDNVILQIAVDSGNHKWISVDGGGVYYLSPNGQQTIKHFTKANSPLPTNSITDIKIDEKTGKVYFVTLDGIVVYQGDVADVTDNFGNVLVYPNPVVTSTFKGLVTLRGLAMKTNIRIVDTAGNLVHQAVARGGFYEWDLNNQRKQRVASGIYFVLMTNEDGTDKATAKIAVVN